MVSFTDIVGEAYQGACTAWLKKELRVENTDTDKVSRYHIYKHLVTAKLFSILFCSYLNTRFEMNSRIYPVVAGNHSFADQNAK